MATEETRRSRSPKKNRGITWTGEATEALLELWAEGSIQMSLEHSKSSKETRAVQNELKTLSGNSKIFIPLCFIKLRVCHVKPGLITRSH